MTGARSFRLWLLLPVVYLLLAPAASASSITRIIDATGDGAGNTLQSPRSVAVDPSGNVYISGEYSDNAFQITAGDSFGPQRAMASSRSPAISMQS